MASVPPGAWPDGGALPSPPSPSRRLFAAGRVRVSPLPASVVAGESIAFRNVGGDSPARIHHPGTVRRREEQRR